MHRYLTSSLMSSSPRWLLFSSFFLRPSHVGLLKLPPLPKPIKRNYSRKPINVVKGVTKATKRSKGQNIACEEHDSAHILWWKENMEKFKKPSTVHLVMRLKYSNLLGLDVNLKNGSLKEGTLNMELLQFKSKFPREVLLCRVGDFYEAIGFDACVLVEHAGLNPFGGLRSDSIPRAGCPVVNLRQTLDDLTRSGFSVCIVEEVQGPTQARSRKGRFISGQNAFEVGTDKTVITRCCLLDLIDSVVTVQGTVYQTPEAQVTMQVIACLNHAHPGCPYVFGLAGVDHDVDFPEPMPVVGISRSVKGYCMMSVFETTKTFSVEDCLTEEAVVTKLRTCRFHHLFLHTSLRHNSSGTSRWGEYGEGGLLWSECSGKPFEWFDGIPVEELLFKVRDIYGLDEEATFRNVTISSERRPQPLYLGTATQIGVIPTDGIPSLLKVLLPSNCVGLPVLYIRDLLLNPPTYATASAIQQACRIMSNLTCSIPEFTCVSAAKLVKLLELREANHIEFCRIKNVADEIVQMHMNSELSAVLRILLEPTLVATGLKVEYDILVNECGWISERIGEILSLDGERGQEISCLELIPREFFEDMESSWKGRVKRVHTKEVYAEVDRAAGCLSTALKEDFLPIVSRVKSVMSPLGGPRGEICYSREHGTVWFKGKRFMPSVWANTQGEEQIRQLRPAADSKGKKVGEEWFTTSKVEEALGRYHEACDKAKVKVLELLRGLSGEMQTKVNILVFSSMLLVIAKALSGHVSEGQRRKWVVPSLYEHSSKDKISQVADKMELTGLSPYWFDIAQHTAVPNTIKMQSMFILTGPNGGGKSSLLRAICAAALLGICGLMVPAESAMVPHFDSIMLHMKAYDSPADGKSSFQIEMSEMRSVVRGATSRSLVLIDEICRGTETAKGTCIAGSIIELLDQIGAIGIVSTHLHGIFDLPLATKRTVNKAMGTEVVKGHIRPTWKLVDGVCRESLAFETAEKEGIPETVISRAEELYTSVNTRDNRTDILDHKCHLKGLGEEWYSLKTSAAPSTKVLQKEVENAVTIICQKKLTELYERKSIPEIVEVLCVAIGVREQPPPSTVGTSSIYVHFRPDKTLYVGQTDDLIGRVRAHRSKEGMKRSLFLYVIVPGKSIACQLETLLINQLPLQGFRLANKADGKHRNFGTRSSVTLETLSLQH